MLKCLYEYIKKQNSVQIGIIHGLYLVEIMTHDFQDDFVQVIVC